MHSRPYLLSKALRFIGSLWIFCNSNDFGAFGFTAHYLFSYVCECYVSVILFIDSFWVDGNLDCSWLLFLGGR